MTSVVGVGQNEVASVHELFASRENWSRRLVRAALVLDRERSSLVRGFPSFPGALEYHGVVESGVRNCVAELVGLREARGLLDVHHTLVSNRRERVVRGLEDLAELEKELRRFNLVVLDGVELLFSEISSFFPMGYDPLPARNRGYLASLSDTLSTCLGEMLRRHKQYLEDRPIVSIGLDEIV